MFRGRAALPLAGLTLALKQNPNFAHADDQSGGADEEATPFSASDFGSFGMNSAVSFSPASASPPNSLP